MRDYNNRPNDKSDENEAQLKTLPLKFHQIAAHVQSFLNGLSRTVRDVRIRHLSKFYLSKETPEIDYNKYAPEFTFSYFLENYWKAGSVFETQKPVVSRRVIDVGCGSGATSLAYLTFLDSLLPAGTTWSIHLTLIDHSANQLWLAAHIIDAAKTELDRLNISVDIKCVDFQKADLPTNKADCVLFGHVLNENSKYIYPFLERALSASAGGGTFFVIERRDDSVWNKIKAAVDKYAVPYFLDSSGVSTADIERNNSSRILMKEFLLTRYMVVDIPTHKSYLNTIRNYFEAWETQNVSLLPRVFTATAKYHDKPFKPPYIGLDQIQGYWEDHVCKQKDIRTEILNIAYTRDKVLVEWQANFIKGSERVEVKGAMILMIDESTGLVYMLREYYRSQKTTTSLRYGHS